jgi:CheY-like chemotaxis protein
MPKVLSVGQCNLDHASISRRLRDEFGAVVIGASGAQDALAALQGGGIDLVLVNRVFDNDAAPGLEFLRVLKADPATSDLPVMLVSNFPDAQRDAEALGALPGFGKADLNGSTARQRLAAVLANEV